MKITELNYTVLFQKEPEGGYTAIVPSLAGCVTYGNDLEEAKKMAREAIELYLESLKEHNEEIPSQEEVFYGQVRVSPFL
ncbi:MAG: antitoxin HicB [Candidatus Levybacteria bacterium CG_4_9_14_3_um_filter_35_16]|nr:MAG: antitoxin HicB [Candidatus Levybacteria bacterium CG_4_10_14_0_8_um_filter_35_23]PJA90818.1 MAG: antitoxin HicB [Candidatus Levybacteria bacterium CG_4_9_14_3_um_filter_35_16]PJC54232.1 MAG: antitoxin HicB [Candidatus Levybacteria bacterium CG_4_9_14_0_2_um_filter_35_21]